jgi:hydroxyacylglutathione hydrolase
VYLIGKCEAPRTVVRKFAKHRLEVAGWFHPDVLDLWQAARGALATIEELDPERLTVRMAAWKTVVLDLRDPEAFRLARVPDALNFSLSNLRASIAGLPHESALTVVCDTGDKSSFAASLLRNLNFRNVAILGGGFRRYLEAGMPVVRG